MINRFQVETFHGSYVSSFINSKNVAAIPDADKRLLGQGFLGRVLAYLNVTVTHIPHLMLGGVRPI